MKAIAKLAGSGVVMLGLAACLSGCAEDNDSQAMKTETGKVVKGAPSNAPDAPKTRNEYNQRAAKRNDNYGKDYKN